MTLTPYSLKADVADSLAIVNQTIRDGSIKNLVILKKDLLELRRNLYQYREDEDAREYRDLLHKEIGKIHKRLDQLNQQEVDRRIAIAKDCLENAKQELANANCQEWANRIADRVTTTASHVIDIISGMEKRPYLASHLNRFILEVSQLRDEASFLVDKSKVIALIEEKQDEKQKQAEAEWNRQRILLAAQAQKAKEEHEKKLAEASANAREWLQRFESEITFQSYDAASRALAMIETFNPEVLCRCFNSNDSAMQLRRMKDKLRALQRNLYANKIRVL